VDQAWFEELSEFIRIPSVSADSERAVDVVRAGEWVCEFLRRAGGEAELRDWEGQPLAVGEISASAGNGESPTVICYGHFDVQPPAPLDLWDSDPFEATVRDGRVYARGVADDKGQLYMQLKAAEELKAADALPVNLRFCCDGEEETGGQSIVDFLAADERGADACVIFDAGMLKRDVPLFNVATRGLIYLHIRVRTGARDLHSGVFGGAALNALHVLVQTLEVVVPRDGRLPELLRAGIAPPTEAELAAWGELTLRSSKSSPPKARARWTRAEDEFYLLARLRNPGRERDRRRVAAPAEDRLGRGARERLDPLAPGKIPDQTQRRPSGCCVRRRPRERSSRSPGSRRPHQGSSIRIRRSCSSAWTRSSVWSAAGRSSFAAAGRCRSCPHSPTRGFRRS
jgi:hypothetical protein